MSPWKNFATSVIQGLRRRSVRLLEDELTRASAEIDRQRDEVARERAENDRLRADNRALLNSLLGTAGIPPLPEPGELEARPATLAIRRPSLHQMQMRREIEEARKARAADRA
jgi:hypothetical protein